MPDSVPDNFGGFKITPPPQATGELLPVLTGAPSSPEFLAWKKTNVRNQKQPGYAIVTVKVSNGNLTSDQMRGLADIADRGGDGFMRVTMTQNIVFAFVPVGALERIYTAISNLGLAGDRAGEISDTVTCPGAYSCNLALTKSMNLGAVLAESTRKYDDPLIRNLQIRISGCPNSCGQHWIGDIGFYGNSRKIDGKEVPYYLMMLGGSAEQFGVAIQSLPARHATTAVDRVLEHYQSNRQDGESFRAYVLRHKVDTFRKLTADITKPTEANPDMYKDWGDDVAFSLQLGRGECAA
jgi:sulfite reductase beta subunit-like hemoprotein